MTPYYEQGGITIYCGDCLEVMPHLAPPIDAIICDPPYGTTACAWDSVIPLGPMWENYKRLIKKAGAVVLFADEPFTSFLVLSNLEWFRYRLTWEKDKSTGFLDAAIKPLKNSEDVCVFYKQQPIYNPQMIKGTAHKRGSKSPGPGAVYGNFSNRTITQSDEYYPKRILEFPVEREPIHPTQKPITLLAYLIRTYTNPGELILDNAAGSGTTGVAAQNEGRRCIMIEQDEDYCRIAVDRLRQPSFFSIPAQPAKVEVKQDEMNL